MANLSVGVGGAWKQVQKVSVGVGGVWKDAWTYLTVAVTATIPELVSEISPTDAQCTLTVANTGALTTSLGTGNQTWLTAGSASQVDVRLTQVSLTGAGSMSGSALATWLNCGTTRSWTNTNTTNGVNASKFTGTLEFRDATTLAVLDTATVTLDANTET
jgi:hypothetical protein